MPDHRDRRFIMRLITHAHPRSSSNWTSKRPPTHRGFSITSSISVRLRGGNCVSACRNRRMSDCATVAPAFICRARPRSATMTLAARWPSPERWVFATDTVWSALPPSATITSWNCCCRRYSSVRGRARSSLNVGIMIAMEGAMAWGMNRRLCSFFCHERPATSDEQLFTSVRTVSWDSET